MRTGNYVFAKFKALARNHLENILRRNVEYSNEMQPGE